MRHRIHGRFEEQLGSEEAAAVMTAISRSETIDEVLDDIRTQIKELRSEINQLYRWTIGSIFAAISLGAALIRLTG